MSVLVKFTVPLYYNVWDFSKIEDEPVSDIVLVTEMIDRMFDYELASKFENSDDMKTIVDFKWDKELKTISFITSVSLSDFEYIQTIDDKHVLCFGAFCHRRNAPPDKEYVNYATNHFYLYTDILDPDSSVPTLSYEVVHVN